MEHCLCSHRNALPTPCLCYNMQEWLCSSWSHVWSHDQDHMFVMLTINNSHTFYRTGSSHIWMIHGNAYSFEFGNILVTLYWSYTWGFLVGNATFSLELESLLDRVYHRLQFNQASTGTLHIQATTAIIVDRVIANGNNYSFWGWFRNQGNINGNIPAT